MSLKKTLQAVVEIITSKPMLTRHDLARRYRCTTDSIDDWHARGTLPKAIYLPGCRSPLWRPMDIFQNETQQTKLSKRAQS